MQNKQKAWEFVSVFPDEKGTYGKRIAESKWQSNYNLTNVPTKPVVQPQKIQQQQQRPPHQQNQNFNGQGSFQAHTNGHSNVSVHGTVATPPVQQNQVHQQIHHPHVISPQQLHSHSNQQRQHVINQPQHHVNEQHIRPTGGSHQIHENRVLPSHPVQQRPVLNSPNHPMNSPNYQMSSPNHPMAASPNHPMNSPNYQMGSPNHPMNSPNHPMASPNHPMASPSHPMTSPNHQIHSGQYNQVQSPGINGKIQKNQAPKNKVKNKKRPISSPDIHVGATNTGYHPNQPSQLNRTILSEHYEEVQNNYSAASPTIGRVVQFDQSSIYETHTPHQNLNFDKSLASSVAGSIPSTGSSFCPLSSTSPALQGLLNEAENKRRWSSFI